MSFPGQKLTSGHLSHPISPRSIALVFFLLWGLSFAFIPPALADGGGPLPSSTPIPSTPLPATSLPLSVTSLPPAQFTPTLTPGGVYPAPVDSTAEVNTFEIVIDENQNPTVQAVTPANQAVLSRAEALEAQGNATTQEEGFKSPLWIFGFITLVIIIAMMNAVAKGIRKKA
jgi:hypothetical protein